jgi:flagellar motor protein MotB
LAGKQIVIEGYADDLPITDPPARCFPTQQDLSAARAIAGGPLSRGVGNRS